METKHVLKILIGVIIVVIILRMVSCRGANAGRPVIEQYSDFDPAEMANVEETFQTATPSGTQATMVPMSTSVDLLPKPAVGSTDYGEFAPKNLGTQNFIDASKLIGVDTQGSTLKNANYSLRRDPPIPRGSNSTGIWNQSTIEADMYRKNLDC